MPKLKGKKAAPCPKPRTVSRGRTGTPAGLPKTFRACWRPSAWPWPQTWTCFLGNVQSVLEEGHFSPSVLKSMHDVMSVFGDVCLWMSRKERVSNLAARPAFSLVRLCLKSSWADPGTGSSLDDEADASLAFTCIKCHLGGAGERASRQPAHEFLLAEGAVVSRRSRVPSSSPGESGGDVWSQAGPQTSLSNSCSPPRGLCGASGHRRARPAAPAPPLAAWRGPHSCF